MILVHLHDRFLLLPRIVAVLLLQRLQFRLQALHFQARPHRTLIERPEREADDDPEQHQHPSVVEMGRALDPEEHAHDDGGERLHEAAQEPAVRVHLVQIAPQLLQALEVLRSRVDVERRVAVGSSEEEPRWRRSRLPPFRSVGRPEAALR